MDLNSVTFISGQDHNLVGVTAIHIKEDISWIDSLNGWEHNSVGGTNWNIILKIKDYKPIIAGYNTGCCCYNTYTLK